jgi:ATP-dependent DNA helicase RecG
MGTIAVETALQEPPSTIGKQLLALPEDQWFDRKSSRISAQDLADDLIGMANAEGGTIILGLWRGGVEGGGDARRRNDWRQAPLDFTLPPVPARFREIACVNNQGNEDILTVIDVEASPRLHANRKDEVFLRVGDENRRLNRSQAQELLYDKGQAYFESSPAEAEVDELDHELLDQYATAVGASDTERLMHSRALVTSDGHLTVAGFLLFGEHPQSRFPAALLRVLRYQGTERGTGARLMILSDTRFEGPIPRMLMAAAADVDRLAPTRQALRADGRFGPVSLVPREAWIEGMVNAVVHRSYSHMGDHVRVEIFDNRIEIESPGRFPGISDPSNPLAVRRFARNPQIARVCADLRFGQELGEGIKRIYQEMRLAGLADPEYHQTSGSVRLTLWTEAIDRELENRLPSGARELLRAIRDLPHPGTGDISLAVGISRPVAIRRLKALRDEGVLEWVGASPKDPRAYWRLRN